MKLVENPQANHPNQSQVIKEKPVQSFRAVFRSQSKILAFVYLIVKNVRSWMFNWALNTLTSEVNNEDTRTTSITLF